MDGVWQPLAEFPNERVFRRWQYKTLNRVASSAGRAVPLLAALSVWHDVSNTSGAARSRQCWWPGERRAVAAERHRGRVAVSLCQEGLAGEDSCNSTRFPFTLESSNLGLAVASRSVPEPGWASTWISELWYQRLLSSSDAFLMVRRRTQAYRFPSLLRSPHMGWEQVLSILSYG